ncbi:MAG: hypothetical protein GKR90_12165 [Pseudomonadales bacterium]|nr:hypothetical protein [Pseudomonadales bacterium]
MTEQPAFVESQIAFLNDEWRDRSEIPRIFSKESRLTNTSRRDVTIHNARLRDEAGDLDLDGSGFVIAKHASSVTDFRNKQVVADDYFPEMRDLILRMTGAADAYPVQFYQVRSRHPEHFFDAYSLYMHCDFSPNGWSKLARSMIRSAGGEREYKDEDWDFSLYNLWRPVGGEVQKDPLVVTDASTVDRADIVDYSAVKDSDTALAAVPMYNDRQRFYYVPNMQVDEVLVFKQMDTRKDKALVCPHTSFFDPTAASDACERESIDIRMVCVFPK